MRLVDADILRKEVEKDRDSNDMPRMWYQGVEYAINHIIHAPTVDAVEVVRCKDCKWWNAFPTASSTPFMHECGCRYPRRGTSADDFCSWGEMDEVGK